MADEPAGLPRRPLFGLFVTPTAADHAAVVEQVRAAERGGLDLIGIQDHPYQRRFLDTFALIADLLAPTERITIFLERFAAEVAPAVREGTSAP